MPRNIPLVKRLSFCALLCLPVFGCAAPAVRQGDRVELSFDCRLKSGELAVTTRSASQVEAEPKSPLYLPRTGPATVTVTAGLPPSHPERSRLSLESEVVQGLAGHAIGMREGERREVELSAKPYPSSPGNQKVVRIAKVRKRDKELRFKREEFATGGGKEPAVGDPFVQDRMVPGRVVEVTEKEVVVRVAPAPQDQLFTPFGPIAAREEDDHYALEIKAEMGRVIRTGNMVGRIVEVDAESIAIDYGHPFAGEKLSCAVEVVRLAPDGAGKAESAQKGGGDE